MQKKNLMPEMGKARSVGCDTAQLLLDSKEGVRALKDQPLGV